ncbi:MAG: peptidase U62 [Anaeromyxobacter sp. RBG_16_69_14]|nr:MAG: peptidase U62 [Anaeromyxobacter sp. RBG_16_69_14]
MAPNDSMLVIAQDAIAFARKKGANEAAAGAYRVRNVEVQWRDGKIEKVSEATTRGLGLELYVEGRYSSVSTSDLRLEAVQRFVEDAVALTRKLAADPHRALPDPSLYEGQAKVDLDLEDPRYGEVDALRRRKIAEDMEAAARSVKGAQAILSVTTGFGDTMAESFRATSNGFVGARRVTDFGMSAQVSVKDPDGRRPEDWDAASARHFAALPSPEEVGRNAAARALSRIGSRKGESALFAMAVENRSAGRLLGFLMGPLAASALQQKRSFLDGKMGQQIASAKLDLADDPLVPRGLGSRLFDSEGIAARHFPVFEKGMLRSYYVDNYYGRKLGMRPTTRGMSNLAWKLGDRGPDALLADMKEGFLVTGFLGGNSNGTTGDFSLGAQGFRVRGGKVAEVIGEMNVSGNHLELWQRLAAVGNDPYPYSASKTPTLVFEGVQFAGV